MQLVVLAVHGPATETRSRARSASRTSCTAKARAPQSAVGAWVALLSLWPQHRQLPSGRHPHPRETREVGHRPTRRIRCPAAAAPSALASRRRPLPSARRPRPRDAREVGHRPIERIPPSCCCAVSFDILCESSCSRRVASSPASRRFSACTCRSSSFKASTVMPSTGGGCPAR